MRQRIDLEKRRRVMERSVALGHCICDARRACPCDVLREQDLCPCAGERPEPLDLSRVRLTDLVHNAGCASKIAAADLEAVLTRLPEVRDPAVISGLAAADDAAIYRITPELCLVQTVDVFTPCVDDPFLFGRICAANCLSDIYAMGGEPRTALSIVGFPSETLDSEIMFRMLVGAMETFAEAGVALIGGHSIKEDEIKLGFAITGTIDPEVAAALDRPRSGDRLVLTKRLGTGVLAFSHQIGRFYSEGCAEAAASMALLNKSAAEAMCAAGATACTDITGFGLFGHLVGMLRRANLSAELQAEALPAFEGAVDAFRRGIIPGAVERNREFVGEDIEIEKGVDEALACLGFDAQTSGGLLIAVPEEQSKALMTELRARGITGFSIGRITPAAKHRILLTRGLGSEGEGFAAPEIDAASAPASPPAAQTAEGEHPCCAEPASVGPADGSMVAQSQRAFSEMMRAMQAPGVLDEKTKELVLFGQVLQSRCASCFDAHFERAQKLGITQQELDEVAWCAIAMGGAPVRTFYLENLKLVQQAQAK